jgi:hypothetical protein
MSRPALPSSIDVALNPSQKLLHKSNAQIATPRIYDEEVLPATREELGGRLFGDQGHQDVLVYFCSFGSWLTRRHSKLRTAVLLEVRSVHKVKTKSRSATPAVKSSLHH